MSTPTSRRLLRPLMLATLGVLLLSLPAEARRRGRSRPAKKTTVVEKAEAPATADEGAGVRPGPSRIEFDDRLVQGQTNKANAIYLFERRESALRSLLKKRTNFHDEIDEMLNDELVR